MHNYGEDNRTVLTLDAGGTNFVFSALKGLEEITKPFTIPSNAHSLDLCLESLKTGFSKLIQDLKEEPKAISFAFPGPSDYANGIIGDLPNLPAFKGGGVPLGPILEQHFGIPVFINNDGNLFVLGEAISGFLPFLNSKLTDSGSQKKYKNLIGVTLGTGYGGGIVHNGNIIVGDNSNAGEVWTMRNKLYGDSNTEESIGVEAIISKYKNYSIVKNEEDIEPKDVFEIAMGKREGDKNAALEAFNEMAIVVGDTLATLVNLIDGPVVIGGGIASAFPLFGQALMKEMNSSFKNTNNREFPRMVCEAFEIESKHGLTNFLKNTTVKINYDNKNSVDYDPVKKVAIGLSKLGTSKAISFGAYAVAIQNL